MKMSKRKSRSHIPALSPAQLEKAIAGLGVARISERGRSHLEQMLRAAANPNAERIDVVIASLDDERKRNVSQTAKALADLTRERVARGAARLLEMPEDEFNRLVEEANRA